MELRTTNLYQSPIVSIMDAYKSDWIALALVLRAATTRIIEKNDIDVSYENNICCDQHLSTVTIGVGKVS
jgi:hypothetical protein